MTQPIDIFFSYAHEDEVLVKDVQRQLCIYKRLLEISPWHDRKILPGSDWKSQIDERLLSARIILLFVSPHFIESDYCYGVEMTEALRRERAGEARLIPIILRPCPWDKTPFARLQALPRDGRAITAWSDRDEVCLDVAHGIMSVAEAIGGSA
jgi:hypothetical protein